MSDRKDVGVGNVVHSDLMRMRSITKWRRACHLREQSAILYGSVTCIWCHESKPQEKFVRSPRYRTGFVPRCKACHAAYMRRRSAELKAGTWKPTRMRRSVPNATRDATLVDIAWAAGFLEGEGHFRRSFGSRDHYGTEYVAAAQVNLEPLLRLQELFGGSISTKNRTKWGLGYIYQWQVSGHRARVVMKAVAPHLSLRRSEQVRKASLR